MSTHVRRTFGIIAGLLALTAVEAAVAADRDLIGVYSGGPHGQQIVFFDYEPGVVVRPYWLPPYRNMHYFPGNHETPRLGRRESFRNLPKPVRAAGYRRSWSSFPVDTIEQPPLVYAPQLLAPSPKQPRDNEEMSLK